MAAGKVTPKTGAWKMVVARLTLLALGITLVALLVWLRYAGPGAEQERQLKESDRLEKIHSDQLQRGTEDILRKAREMR